MARILTSSTANAAETKRGSAPRIILRIDWGGAVGTKYYSDHDLTTPITAEGRIVNAAEIGLALSEQGVHSVSDVSITLADHDGVLAGYCEDIPLELKSATVYQHFIGNSANDLVPLLVGHIDDPVVWKESDATLSFDITDIMTGYGVTVGNVASVDDFETIVGSADGAALPLVFGKVDELKCIQVSGGLRGTVLRDIWAATQTIFIENGENFPQEENISIRILSEEIEGVMRGRAFSITNRTAEYDTIYAGATVRLAGDDQVYIANDARSLEITSVYALKNFKVKSGRSGTRDVEQLVEVPAELYEINLNDTETFPELGRAVTTITFPTALTDIDDSEWASEDIWVDISGYTADGSTLPENPADIIKSLMHDFGDVPLSRIDSTTFTAAKTSLGSHIFGFALREQRDLKDLVSDLAYQAQCQIMVIATKVYLFYISNTPGTEEMSFSDSNVGEASVERTWLAVEDIWSEISVSYNPDLSGRSERNVHKFTLKNSDAETRWGRRTSELTFWAYRNLGMAKSVAQHYLNYHSAAWQMASMTLYLDALALMPLDWVSIGGLPWWSTGQKARVESTSLSPGGEGEPDNIKVNLFIPVYPGCSGSCEAACEVGGCEGSAEHSCGSETGCATTCETSCQEACQLICVTTCQASCQLNCQLACESSEETPQPEYEFQLSADSNIERGVAFNLTIQSRVIDPAGDDTSYTPDGNVSIALLGAGDDSITPSITDDTGWTSGAKTVSCTIDGGSSPCEATIHVEDTATGRIGEITVVIAESGDMGFSLTAPGTVTRGAAFNLAIQSVYLESGNSDTAFTPADDVNILKVWEDVGASGSKGILYPLLTDNTGWTDGAKTVSCRLDGGSGNGSMRILVTDFDSDRSGAVELTIDASDYGFKVACPSNIERGAAFNLSIQSIDLPAGTNDTGYTPAGNVEIDVVSGDDSISPDYTDNTGWTSGAKTVSCTLSGGSTAGKVLIRVRDTASGRVGYANFGTGESGDANITVASTSDYGYGLTVSGGEVTRFMAFDLNVQSISLATGSDETGYTPAGDVSLSDTEGTYIPASTDNTGWTDGGKDVASVIVGASTGTGTVVTASDTNSGREGSVLFLASNENVPDGWNHDESRVTVIEPSYKFALTVPQSVDRGKPFEVKIKSVSAATGDPDTAYSPSDTLDIYTDSESDLPDPDSTASISQTWAATTAYSENDLRIPTTPNGYIYECTTAGTSGATEPSWPSTLGNTMADGTAVWTCRSTAWANGEQTILLIIDGGSGESQATLYVQDYDTGRIGSSSININNSFEFSLSAPGQVDPDTAFTLTIQSVESVTLDPDTTYVPAVELLIDDDSESYNINPGLVNDVGWENGAKSVSCKFQGSEAAILVRLTATDQDSGRTGYTDIMVGQQYLFIVTVPAAVERGTPFTITIQSYDVITSEVDTSYTPAGNVTIGYSERTDESDDLSPTYTDNTGWTDGSKTVTCSIVGGTNSDTMTIRVYDPNSGREGFVSLAIASTQTTKSADQLYRFFGEDTVFASYTGEFDGANYYEPDDWDTESSNMWSSMQDDALANFDADTTLASGSVEDNFIVARHYINDNFSYIAGTNQIYGGFVRIPIDPADKTGLVLAQLRIIPIVQNNYGDLYPTAASIWSPYRHLFNLNIVFTESSSSFTSGQSLRNATPDMSISFTTLKEMIEAQGGNPTTNTDVYINIPTSVIENLSGNYLYVWVWISASAKIPYSYPYFRGTTEDKYQTGNQYIDARKIRLELHK